MSKCQFLTLKLEKVIEWDNNAENCIEKKIKVRKPYFSKTSSRHLQVCKLLIRNTKCCNAKLNHSSFAILNSFHRDSCVESTKGKIKLTSFGLTIVSNELLRNFKDYLVANVTCLFRGALHE